MYSFMDWEPVEMWRLNKENKTGESVLGHLEMQMCHRV